VDDKPQTGTGGGDFFTPIHQPASREGWRFRLYRL